MNRQFDKGKQVVRSKGGVVIPNETVADSERKKQSKRKTLSQLPVYRDASRLKYVTVLLVLKGAKKLSGFYDDLLRELTEVRNLIGFADYSRTAEDRTGNINSALVLITGAKEDFKALRDGGVIGQDEYDKIESLENKIVAQLIGWRDYTNNEGVGSITQ